MKIHLKKTIIASLLLTSCTVFAQSTPLIVLDKKEPACECADKVTPIEKKKVAPKKIVKKVTKKSVAQEINMISQNNILPEEINHIESVIYPYDDVSIIPSLIPQEKASWFSKNPPPLLVFVAHDKNGQPYPDDNFVFNNDSNITLIQISTDLKYSRKVDLATNNPYEPLHKLKGCQAFFLKYQLIGNQDYKVQRFFLDANNNITYSFPDGCTVMNKDERDNTDYTSKNYIADLSWSKSTSVDNKPFDFNMHLIKNGKDYFGKNVNAYIVDSNFENIYFPKITPHRKGPYFGTQFEHDPLKSGKYNVIIDYEVDEGHETIFATRTVQ